MKEQVSKQQTSKIAIQLKAMIEQIKNMVIDKLAEIAPYEEQTKLYIKVKIDKPMLVDFSIYNGSTKAIIIKQYPIIDLLDNCKDIFNITTMVDSDTRLLYNKSKEKVFKKNTTLYI